MTLTAYQLKNPYRGASSSRENNLTYLERSFERANKEEIKQWIETGLIERIMKGEERTQKAYSHILPRLLLSAGARSYGHQNEAFIEECFTTLWLMSSGPIAQPALDSWLIAADNRPVSERLIRLGANPHAFGRDAWGNETTALSQQLRRRAGYLPQDSRQRYTLVEEDRNKIEARIERWLNIGRIDQKAKDHYLSHATKLGLEEMVTRKEYWPPLRDLLVAMGANPLPLALTHLAKKIHSVEAYDGMYYEEGDHWYVEAAQKKGSDLTPTEKSRVFHDRKGEWLDDQRARLAQWAAAINHNINTIQKPEENPKIQWKNLLRIEGGGAICRSLLEAGYSPWNSQGALVTQDPHDKEPLVLFNGRRIHGIWQELQPLVGLPSGPGLAWLREQATLFLSAQSSTNRHNPDITPDELELIGTLSQWAEDPAQAKTGIHAWAKHQCLWDNRTEKVDALLEMLGKANQMGVLDSAFLAESKNISLSSSDIEGHRPILAKWIKSDQIFQYLCDRGNGLPRIKDLLVFTAMKEQRFDLIGPLVREGALSEIQSAASAIEFCLLDKMASNRHDWTHTLMAMRHLLAAGVSIQGAENEAIQAQAWASARGVLVRLLTTGQSSQAPNVSEMVSLGRMLCELGADPNHNEGENFKVLLHLEARTEEQHAQRLEPLVPFLMALIECGGNPIALTELPEPNGRPLAILMESERLRHQLENQTLPAQGASMKTRAPRL